VRISEKQLAAVTVGELRPLNKPIALQPYNPDWPVFYGKLERQVHAALGSKALLIAHVGSTSVPGLSAKPVIDMVLAVANSADEDAYIPPLEGARYTLRIREPEWFQHRMLKTPVIDGNLHVFSQGCEEIGRMLALRNWLRTNENDRSLYERTKRELAARSWRYTQNYADAKSDVVREILGRALNDA